MKRNYVGFIVMILASMIFTVHAQTEPQEYKIPLSEPGKIGKLDVRLHRGSVKVYGYNGSDVIVKVIPVVDGDEDNDRTKEGLRRIPNTATQFKIVEENNVVTVSGSHNNRTDFEIQVPRSFNIKLKTHHDGYIEVGDVSGEIEADGHNDDVNLQNVAGSVVADTHHGEITVIFKSVNTTKSMAFSTYHGDIDVTFSDDINASARIKTSRGEIYSDFDIDLKVEMANVESSTKSKGTKIEIGGWLRGDLGKGGPEYLFSSYHGDIVLRKKSGS